ERERRTNRGRDASTCDPDSSLALRASRADGHSVEDAGTVAPPRLLQLLRIGVGAPTRHRSIFNESDTFGHEAWPRDELACSRVRDAAVSNLLRTAHSIAAAGRLLDLDRDQ